MADMPKRRRRSRGLLWLRKVSASYWFVPTLMTIGAIALSYGMLGLDHRFVADEPMSFLYEGDAAGARAVLGTIAGSMITVAGVVFSITVVALSLASQQFGPMLLRNFMSDRPNQIVLGTFVATFVYCLLVLRAVRGPTAFVPHASVTGALVLAIVSLGVLIFFIHHIATSIRPEGVLRRVSRELCHATESIYPERLGEPEGEIDPDIRRDLARGEVVRATRDGYVELIADGSLMDAALERDLVVEALVVPGEFVVRRVPILRVHPRSACDEATLERLRSVIVIGEQKDGSDRVQEGLDELVQLCLRALSPALNDPLTACATLDGMTAALARIARRSMPPQQRFDEDGRLRIIARREGFDALVRRVFDPVRRNAKRQATVFSYLIACVEKLRASVREDAQRQALLELVLRIERTARDDLVPSDAEVVLPEVRRLAAILGAKSNGNGARLHA